MAFGIKIINNSNSIQIDDTYKNLEFKSKGTINTSSLPNQLAGNVSNGPITITTSELPIIAFRDTQGELTLNTITSLGSNQYSLSLEIYRPSSAHYDITYYIFGYSSQVNQVGLPQMGFVSRDTAGTIVYRSDQKTFNVVDIITDLSPLSTTGYSTTRTYDTGKIYAVCFWRDNSGAGVYDPGGGANEYVFTGGFNCSSNTVKSTWRLAYTRSATIASSIQESLLAFVIDVTGL